MPYKTSNADKIAAIIPGYPVPTGTHGTLPEMITVLEENVLRLHAASTGSTPCDASSKEGKEQLAAIIPGYPVPTSGRGAMSLPEVIEALENAVLSLDAKLAEAKKTKPAAVVTPAPVAKPATAKPDAKAKPVKELFGAERLVAAMEKTSDAPRGWALPDLDQ